MSNLFKKAIFLFVVILGLFFIGAGLYVHASQSITMTDGAQIRTTGDRQGLRFTATASEAFAEGSEHGYYVALGEHALLTMTTAIQANEITVGSNKLVKIVIPEPDLTFSLVIYNIPERAYKQDITAIPYIYHNGTYTFPSLLVTRNIAEIAVAAYPTYGGEVPPIVASAATQQVSYNMNGGAFVGEKEFMITQYNGTADGTKLVLGDVAAGFVNQFWNVLYLTQTSNPNVFEIKTYTTGALYTGEYDKIIGIHSSCEDGVSAAAANSLVKASSVGKYIHLSSVPIEAGSVSIRAKAFSADEFDYATNNTSQSYVGAVDTKGLEKLYYDFKGWYTNSEFSGEVVTTIAAGNSGATINLYAKFDPTVYTISYELNNGACSDTSRPTTYTYVSGVVNLPLDSTMSRDGYTFDGWYEDAAFSVGPVTNIPAQSHGNKTFYACWIPESTPEFAVSNDDVTVLNVVTPDIIVNSSLENGTGYLLTGTGLSADYEDLQIIAYSSIANALSAAASGSTIYVTAGTYSAALDINTSSLTIIGPNYNIHGHGVRVNEAVISGLVTINGAGTTLDGLKFTLGGAIKIAANNTVIKHIYTNAAQIDCNANNRRGVIVDGAQFSGLQVLNSYLFAKGAQSTYQTGFMAFTRAENLVVRNNYIENEATTTGTAGQGMYIYNLYGTFAFEQNEVHFGTDGYVLYFTYNTNGATSINIIDNYFTGNASQHAASIFIRKAGSGCTTTIRGNQFINFAPSTFGFSLDTGSTVNITYNYYGPEKEYKVTAVESAIITANHNCYMGGIHADDVTANDTTTYDSFEAWQAAYELAYPKS
ncbi:MAG TPA: InlB B-repeat-containing protein [Bacilli bacterium]|nr:InlB B-repeat-containing protein [Bacilli bacterium]